MPQNCGCTVRMELILLETAQYNCPNCNARLKFTPETQELSCEYCGGSFSIEEIKNMYADKEDLINAPAEETPAAPEVDEFEAHTNVYHCSSCGADIMCDDEQTALFCYYCHNPVILAGKLTGEYKPDKIIGFRVTRDSAIARFHDWIGNKRFIPSDFKSEQQLEKMTGLYVPFWKADTFTQADYEGTGHKSRSWVSGSYRYTETSSYDIVRRGRFVARGIPADGESKIDDELMEAIEPFDYYDLKPFSMSYLSGFFADKYDVDKNTVFKRIRERSNSASRKALNETISGYGSISTRTESYEIKNTDWEYVMLPVWFMTYLYEGKVYEFAVNGQTGKLAGTPPLDKGKLTWFCAGIGAAVAAVIYIIGGFMS